LSYLLKNGGCVLTCKESKNSSYRENNSCYEDEISLIDILRVIWKWKWAIMAGTLLCAVAAAVISFQMPRVYEITTSIEPGIISVGNDGKFIYLDTTANIGRKINEGIYNRQIIKRLDIDPLRTGLKFKANVKKGNLVRIVSQWEEKNVGLGLKASNELSVLLAGDYQKIIDQKKGSYSNQISMKQNDINNLKTQKKLQQANLKNIGQTKEKMLGTITEVKENMEKIIRQRDRLLKSEKTGNSTTLLLYSTTAQQNLTYFNQLRNELYGLNAEEAEIKTKIEDFPEDIARIKSELNILTLEKGLIGNIKLVQEPEVSLYPVKPKKMLIVLLAGFVGLFFFLFIAFFIEYIRNASKDDKLGVAAIEQSR
jgi:LPS O-antigen subunit length determinant protein (WzzB/FepE family)